jgi:adenosylhomocysteine nucleosidase
MKTHSLPPAAQTCVAGIVFAIGTEADAFEGRARDTTATIAGGLTFQEGTVAGRRVAWVVSGAGTARASTACQLLIDGHRPGLVISAGFAGALDEHLTRGRVVSPMRASRIDHEPIDLTPATALALPQELTILTVDRVVCTAADKQALAAATAADLVDMETWGVATVARAAGLACVSVRVVSDGAGEDLPREMTDLVQPQSTMRRFGAALRAVSRRPGAAVDMWRLWEQAVVDARTLADALERFVGQLPAGDPVSPP